MPSDFRPSRSGCSGGQSPPHQNLRRWLRVEQLEDRITPEGRPLPVPMIMVGGGDNNTVKAFLAETGDLAFERTPFDGFAGGVRVAAADLDHDGMPDLIAAAGPGGGPHVKVYSGRTGDVIRDFAAYDPTFTGGVYVAGGDVTGDGWEDLITAAGYGGGPHVKVFDGETGAEVYSFYAFAESFNGGATVMAADFTGDGRAELAVGAGPGGGPHVKIFDLGTGDVIAGPLGSFYAFDPACVCGVDVGTSYLTGDITGDGRADLVVGTGPGVGSLVRVFDGVSGAVAGEFSPYGSGMTNGVRLSTAFVDDDAFADIVVGPGPGGAFGVKVFAGTTLTELAAPYSPYTPFGPGYTGGVYVAGSNDPDNVIAYLTNMTVMQGGSLTLTATFMDGNTGNGLQYPIGTATFSRQTPNGWETLGTAAAEISYYDYFNNTFSGKTYASLDIDPLTWPGGPPPNGPYHPVRVTLSPGSSWFLSATGVAQVYVRPAFEGGLTIIDSVGNPLPDDQEMTAGGWVAVNNDNDNYNFPSPTSLQHIYDKDESGVVAGENDLVKILVNVPNGGTNYLDLSQAPNLRVWGTPEKGSQITSTTPLSRPANGDPLPLWVEAVQMTGRPRDQLIRLWNYVDPVFNSPAVIVDQIRFTIYEVNGAMNVPGYSRHLYQATGVGVIPSIVGINAVTGVEYMPPPDGAFYAARRNIVWDGGAAVGVYRVYPAATNNFYVDRQVNVVKVEISPVQGADNRIYTVGVPEQDVDDVTLPPTEYDVRIISTSTKPAMELVLTLKKIEGPAVGGIMRGVKFIESGILQDVKIHEQHATYTGKRRVFALEGGTYLDAITQGPDASTLPWYDSQGTSGGPTADPRSDPDPGRGLYMHGTDPVAGSPVTNIKLHVSDRPGVPATDSMHLLASTGEPTTSSIPPANRLDVIRFEIQLNFRVYLGVRTRETVFGADTIYTQRATSWWEFDGSGDMTGYDWQKDNGTGNTSAGFLTEVTTGVVVPITTGTPINTLALQLGGPGSANPAWRTV